MDEMKKIIIDIYAVKFLSFLFMELHVFLIFYSRSG